MLAFVWSRWARSVWFCSQNAVSPLPGGRSVDWTPADRQKKRRPPCVTGSKRFRITCPFSTPPPTRVRSREETFNTRFVYLLLPYNQKSISRILIVSCTTKKMTVPIIPSTNKAHRLWFLILLHWLVRASNLSAILIAAVGWRRGKDAADDSTADCTSKRNKPTVARVPITKRRDELKIE